MGITTSILLKIESKIVFINFIFSYLKNNLVFSINRIKKIGTLVCITNKSINFQTESGFAFDRSLIISVAKSFSEYIERSFDEKKYNIKPLAVATSIFKDFSKSRATRELIERDGLIFSTIKGSTEGTLFFEKNNSILEFLNQSQFNVAFYKLHCRFENYVIVLSQISKELPNGRGIYIFGSSADTELFNAQTNSLNEAFCQYLIYHCKGSHEITKKEKWAWLSNVDQSENKLKFSPKDIQTKTKKFSLFFNSIAFHKEAMGLFDRKIYLPQNIREKFPEILSGYHFPVIGIKSIARDCL